MQSQIDYIEKKKIVNKRKIMFLSKCNKKTNSIGIQIKKIKQAKKLAYNYSLHLHVNVIIASQFE